LRKVCWVVLRVRCWLRLAACIFIGRWRGEVGARWVCCLIAVGALLMRWQIAARLRRWAVERVWLIPVLVWFFIISWGSC